MKVTSPIDLLINPQQQEAPVKPQGFLDKEDFLLLLVTQLRYQSPLDPMENQDFGAQLAQFSSLEQLTNLNQTMESTQQTNLYLTQAITNALSASLIGKRVLAENNKFYHISSHPDTLNYSLTGAAENVKVRIVSPVGTVLYEEELGSMPKGEHEFVWNGIDTNGNLVSDGQYLFEVFAEGSDGANVADRTMTTGTITAIRFHDGNAFLIVNNVEIPINEVIEILPPLTDNNANN